ncbi:MAG: HIT domain-containing protein [Phycisphaeraceae bacterium]|nr:HIT domain-containing protein [Phycisphaeraceae bacterium]
MAEAPNRGHPAIHAPWRLEYLEGLGGDPASGGASFLASYWDHPERDEHNLVVHRDSHGMVLLNRFPYANGHLLVALGEGRPRLLDYTEPQRAHLWRLTDLAMALLERTLEPQGVNVGINQGRAAGAGVPGHLHVHLVPRWGGDVNFITVVGSVRVIPAALETMAQRFRAGLALLPTPNAP